MRLKSLEITGFKSFMDRTLIRFDEGITGVVGPNGCGKSNIVDAIRWVLGEQSARHLRGGNMSDVIFNGSQSRAPAGLAEVTLTFKNDRPEELPPRYRTFSEIAVGRRLFRTGESEYLINKSACRLLDITEVFLGTGLGTKAYSIIEQGRIGLIVSAKPDDRRGIIEEAAGITRFKSKRKAAERRMEQTEANLLRIGDIVSELQKRQNSLQRQAKKAERFKALKQELREAELRLSAQRWLEIRALHSALQGRSLEAQAAFASGHERLETLEASLRSLREEITLAESKVGELQAGAATAEGNASVSAERASSLERERTTLGARAKESREEIELLGTRAKELVVQIEALEASRRSLEAARGESEATLGDSQEEASALRALLGETEQEASAERSAALDLVRILSEGSTHLGALDQQQVDLLIRIERSKEETGYVETRRAELGAHQEAVAEKINSAQQLHLDLAARQEHTGAELGGCKVALDTQDTELSKLRDILAETRARHESLSAIQQNYEGYEQAVRTVMLEQDSIEGLEPGSVIGLVADVVRALPKYERAIQAALGEGLQHMLVQDHEVAASLVAHLQSKVAGRGGFLPLEGPLPNPPAALAGLLNAEGVLCSALEAVEVDAGCEPVLERLLGGVLLVETLGHATALWPKLQAGQRIVTLEGEVLSDQGLLIGGESEGMGAHLLELRRERDELAASLRGLEEDLGTHNARRLQLLEQRTLLEEQLAALSKSQHEEQIQIVSQEKEQNRLDDELARLRERHERATEEAQTLAATVAEIETERGLTQLALKEAQEEQLRRNEASRALEARRASLETSLKEKNDALTTLQVHAAEQAERHTALCKELEQLEARRLEGQARLEGLQRWVGGSAARFDEISGGMVSAQASARAEREHAEALRDNLQSAREALKQQNATLKIEEQTLEASRKERESENDELGSMRLEEQELAIELTHLQEQVLERHDIPMSDAVYSYHLSARADAADLEAMATLRRKLESMGEVNLTALSEFSEVSERYEFLSAQKEDLEASLTRLSKAIVQINRTSRRRFVETFEAVNDRFQKIFPRMFNGGRAELILMDPAHPLESGVDIAAQPPGKKLQSITLLSGGEKALTAISLLFAIFLVRPTPFCLLDEVDAPLDDHNVGRYNQTVAEMAVRSQFVLITHNKLTMEIADTLYGVTMQEPGVSKLVSVRLKAEEHGDPTQTADEAAA